MTIGDLFTPFADELQLLPSPRVPDPPLIEWTSAFGDFFFRIKGADPQVLWCDLGYTITPKRPLPPARQVSLTKRASRAFGRRKFFRVVPFEDGKGDWALVRPKRALVKSPAKDGMAVWVWYANFAAKKNQLYWLSQSPAWFKKWIGRKGETAALARRCVALGEEKWHWFAEETSRCQPLLKAALILETAEQDAPCRWRLFFQRRPDSPTHFVAYYEWLGGVLTTRDGYLPSQSAHQLLSIARQHFPVAYECGLTVYGRTKHHPAITFDLSSITQHERLEAALLWRDFATEIGKTDEIEPLLRALMRAG